MTDRIEPALRAEEWADDGDSRCLSLPQDSDLPALIALANAALPDSDRRKITHRTVATLRDAARVAELDGQAYEDLLALADVLASYLPPDPDELPPYPRLTADIEQKLNRKL